MNTDRDKGQGPRIILLLTLLVGMCIGWSARVNYSKDRYIQALAERHEAERTFWSRKTDDIITNNTLERKRRDGKKTD